MTIEALGARIPEYAKDLKLNLSSLSNEVALTEQQRAGTFVASAIASRNAEVIKAVVETFGPKLSAEALTAAKTAAAIMGMNNIYYRFVHLMHDSDYGTMPAKLRMNALAKPGVEKVDFELWSLAVSAVNGCGMCLEAHEREVKKAGLSSEAVQAAVRIAAVVHAIAATLDGEDAVPTVAVAA